jgi:hypothetical protein
VYLYHDPNKHEIQEDAHESKDQIAIEHVNAFVLPWTQLVLQVDRVQQVLEQYAQDAYQQHGILEIMFFKQSDSRG